MFFRIYFPITILILVIAVLILSYLGFHPNQTYLFNSDALYLPSLFSDVLGGNGKFQDWHLTSASYYFPDYIMFLIAYICGKNIYMQIIFFTIIQVLLLFLSLYMLMKQVLKKDFLLLSVLVVVILTWCALNAGEPFLYMQVSAHHYGIFIFEICFVGLFLYLLKCESGIQKRYIKVTLTILTFLMIISDRLSLVQIFVPFFFSFKVIPLLNDEKKLISKDTNKSTYILFKVLCGVSLILIIGHITHIHNNLTEFLSVIEKFHHNAPFLFYFVCIYLLFIMFYCIYALKQRSFLKLPKELNLLIVFTLFSSIMTLAAVLFMRHPFAARYLIPTFTWPIILGFILIAYFLKDKFYYLGRGIVCVFSSLLILNTSDLLQNNGISYNYYPNNIACIDRALKKDNLSNGISDYWDAKLIQTFSKQNIILAQHSSSLLESKWITSNNFFKSSYDFALISNNASPDNKIPEIQLYAINGKPKKTLICGNQTLLIYGKGQLSVHKKSV